MHFALPPKGAPSSTPYSRSSRSPSFPRRRTIQVTAIVAVAFCTFYLLLSFIFGGDVVEVVPAGTPKAVIVTVFDEKMSKEYVDKIKENRIHYAEKHGYTNFFTNTTTYKAYLGNSPSSWSIVPATRHALTLHLNTPWIFALSPHALIMNPSLSLHHHILAPDRMSSLMLKDIPVVPPDSVIHTFSHLKPEKVDLVLTQDGESLARSSFLLRNGDWAKYLLDSWFDGLYRSYNFQKAEGHALEHLVQWHPTILSHLILIPQRLLNAYNFEAQSSLKASAESKSESLYAEGDLLVNLHGCDGSSSRSCEKEMEAYWGRWKEVITLGRSGGGSGGIS